MPSRSIRDERDVAKRAGAPGRGSLLGKKKPPTLAAPKDSSTKDLSVVGAAGKLRGRKQRIDDAVDG